MSGLRVRSIGVVCGLALFAQTALAQQATIRAPLGRVGDGFFEKMGVGGFNPNAGGQLGVAVLGKNADLFFNFSAAQGSSRRLSSVAPSVTVMNGHSGFISSGFQQPFVTGVVPVVGGGGTSPLAEKLSRLTTESNPTPSRPISPRREPGVESTSTLAPTPATRLGESQTSTAGQSADSLAEIRRQKVAAAETANDDALQLQKQAQAARAGGKPAAARYYYQMALRRATGELKAQLTAELRTLQSAKPTTR